MWHGLGDAPVVLGPSLKDVLLRDVEVPADDIEGSTGVTLQAKDVACSNRLSSGHPWQLMRPLLLCSPLACTVDLGGHAGP